jgi:hypothetical protein
LFFDNLVGESDKSFEFLGCGCRRIRSEITGSPDARRSGREVKLVSKSNGRKIAVARLRSEGRKRESIVFLGRFGDCIKPSFSAN